MKKKTVLMIVVAMATCAVLGYSLTKSSAVDFFEENINALSRDEGSGTCCNQVGATCYVAGFPKQVGAYYSSSGPCI